MSPARVAVVVAIFAMVFGLGGLAVGGYCVLQNRELANQLARTQEAVQTLAAGNQDLSDRIEKAAPGRGGLPREGPGSGKMDPELANALHGIEARLDALDGGRLGFGVTSDVSQLKLDVARLDSKVDELARGR